MLATGLARLPAAAATRAPNHPFGPGTAGARGACPRERPCSP